MNVFLKHFGLILLLVCASGCSTKQQPPASNQDERPTMEAAAPSESPAPLASETSEYLEDISETPPQTNPPDLSLRAADAEPDPTTTDPSAKPDGKPTPTPKDPQDPPLDKTSSANEPAPDDKRSARSSRQILRVSHILDRLEIREVFKFDGTLADAAFAGQEPSAIYNAHRLQPSDGKSLGFGLQVWKLPSGARALEQFESLFSQSVGGVKTKDAGDRSFRVEHHKLRSLVFLDQRHQAVAWLTCDDKLCSYEQLVQYAQRVRKRF